MIETTRPVRILGFAGSLRQGSYNRALLHAASELAPEDMLIEIFDLLQIPLYNAACLNVGVVQWNLYQIKDFDEHVLRG